MVKLFEDRVILYEFFFIYVGVDYFGFMEVR